MNALICGWMLQKIRTTPGAVRVRVFDAPLRYSPRSKTLPGESENTLWKMPSLLGNVTAVPTGTASTRGVKVLFFCSMVAGAAGRPGATLPSGSA